MKIRSILGALVIAALPFTPVWAENMTPEDIKKLVDEAVTKRLQEHERREGTTERREGDAASTATTEPGIGALPEVGRDLRTDKQPALSFGSTGSGRLVYAKPFVSAPKAIVGGYFDIQYRAHSNGVLEGYGNGVTNGFDQQRFVPFIYADITEHVKFASELEIEHGIRGAGENEISLEFAFIDYLINEPVNLRAGIILIPIGKFNLLHDSPLNDLTDRPLVSQFVIPSTMSETGAGFYGTFYPGRTGKLDYEFYYTTGPCGYNQDGTPRVKEETGTKDSRQRKCEESTDGLDINNGKAVSGRLAYSPMLGVEVAGSNYYGNQSPYSYNPLSITAIDWTLQKGPFELIGEAAWSYARGNSRAIPGNTIGFAPGSLMTGVNTLNPAAFPPQRMQGFYIQGNYHFMPTILTKLSPKRFGEGSTFTAVIRWDQVDLNQDNTGPSMGRQQQISFGLNYRPVEDAVFKISYQYLPETFNVNSGQQIHDQALVLSVASYF
jgi:hypothetical protein